MTRIALLHIPFFREVLVESFSCESCGFKNSTIKSAGAIQEKGSKFTLKLESLADLQRQIVRNETAVLRIEDLDLETPASQGHLTTMEGVLSQIYVNLQADQSVREKEKPELYKALAPILRKLDAMLQGQAFPITISVDDPSGNSFIEPSPEDKGNKYTRTDYFRSREQNIALGLVADDEDEPATNGQQRDAMAGVDIVDREVYEIPAKCPACGQACTVNMKQVNIPHFKEVIIMATVCEHCGYRTSDVKTGGAIPELGKRITLKINNKEDLSRDILKSESCVLRSEELSMEVQPGTLGGRFTTVEGLLAQVKDQLKGQIFDVDVNAAAGHDVDITNMKGGDSMVTSLKTRWLNFFDKLDKAINAEMPFSITLQDPLAASYVQALDNDHDGQISTEEYERTEEELEDLGLKDMKTEGYEEDQDGQATAKDGPS